MTAGSKIKDDKQEYQYSLPFVTPSGHEMTFYDTPENERLVIKHTSGSRIEFKADGSCFVKIMKDMHVHGSILSSQKGEAKPADSSTFRFDTDVDVQVGGAHKAAERDEHGAIGARQHRRRRPIRRARRRQQHLLPRRDVEPVQRHLLEAEVVRVQVDEDVQLIGAERVVRREHGRRVPAVVVALSQFMKTS